MFKYKLQTLFIVQLSQVFSILAPVLSAFQVVVSLPLLFVACIGERLDDCLPSGYNVYVKIHWDGLAPGDSLPAYGMHIQMYPEQGGSFIGYPLGVHGGAVWLPPGLSHTSVCFDYAGMEYLSFRNMKDASLFEIYKESTFDAYNTRRDAGSEEPVVYEPFPYTFYATRETSSFTAPAKGMDTLHCYPRNRLHEFTYLVYGVEGVENVASSCGAVSGMSGSYYPLSGELSDVPSTVLFRRSLALENGRFPGKFQWRTTDTIQRIPVPEYGSIPVCPKWFPSGWAHPSTGWNGDWIIGAFSVFGVTSSDDIANQLTVECFTHANYYYYASWGYWKGEWDDTVTTQIMGALGYWEGCPAGIEKGSHEAQSAWRKHNGGFDIVLANDGRLVVPEDVGLKAPVSGWDGVEIPLD
jgi:hypothetical protein